MKDSADSEKYVSFYFDFAVIYAGLGEKDKAMDYLDKAYEERLGGFVFLKNLPVYKHLKRISQV